MEGESPILVPFPVGALRGLNLMLLGYTLTFGGGISNFGALPRWGAVGIEFDAFGGIFTARVGAAQAAEAGATPALGDSDDLELRAARARAVAAERAQTTWLAANPLGRARVGHQVARKVEIAPRGSRERVLRPPAAGSPPLRVGGRSGPHARPCARPVCILRCHGPPPHRSAESHT